MELIFTKQADRWVAEFIATDDFNLHIEGVVEGNVSVFQRGSESGNYAFVKDGTPHPSYANVYDYDFAALIYPKFIKVSCATEPIMAEVTFNSSIPIKPEGDNEESDSNKTAGDVRFFDYDGTLLYSYSYEEAYALTELPPLPKHEGLEVREWNYTLEDIRQQGFYGPWDLYGTYLPAGDYTFNGNTYKAYTDGRSVEDCGWAYLFNGDPSEDNLEYTYIFKEDEIFKDGGRDKLKGPVLVGKADIGACVYDLDGEQAQVTGVHIWERGTTELTEVENSVVGLLSIPTTVEYISDSVFYNLLVTREIKIPISTVIENGGYNTFINVAAPNFYHNGSNISAIDGIVPLAIIDFPQNVSEATYLPRNCIAKFSTINGFYNVNSGYDDLTLLDFTNVDYIPWLDGFPEVNGVLMIVVPDDLYDDWISETNWSDVADYIYVLSEVPWIK